jgi:hypothetical protein
MSAPESMKIAVETAAKHLDEIIANDEQKRIRKPDGFRWLTLNNLRLGLARLPATELAKVATLSGAQILSRFPGPTS